MNLAADRLDCSRIWLGGIEEAADDGQGGQAGVDRPVRRRSAGSSRYLSDDLDLGALRYHYPNIEVGGAVAAELSVYLRCLFRRRCGTALRVFSPSNPCRRMPFITRLRHSTRSPISTSTEFFATVVSAITHEGVGIPKGVELNWKRIATNKEIGAGKTPISTFVIRAENGVADVEMEPMFSYEVRIETRAVGTLKWIGNAVYRAYYEVDRGEKALPFLPHPL